MVCNRFTGVGSSEQTFLPELYQIQPNFLTLILMITIYQLQLEKLVFKISTARAMQTDKGLQGFFSAMG